MTLNGLEWPRMTHLKRCAEVCVGVLRCVQVCAGVCFSVTPKSIYVLSLLSKRPERALWPLISQRSFNVASRAIRHFEADIVTIVKLPKKSILDKNWSAEIKYCAKSWVFWISADHFLSKIDFLGSFTIVTMTASKRRIALEATLNER